MQPIVHKHVTYRDIRLDGNSMEFLGDIHGDLHIHTDSTEPRKKPFHTIPFAPDPDFVDRPDILAWIRDQFAWPGARAALVGLGGVGKSQIAIQYAYSVHSPDEKERTSRKFVFWVHASSRARFEQAYRNLADRLALPGRDNPKIDCLKLVSDWLCDEENGKWTMILDNVDEAEIFYPRQHELKETSEQTIALADYLPQSLNGSVLITSRSRDVAARLVGGYPKVMEIAPMNEEEALQLLSNKMRDKVAKGEGTALLRALDNIPLAITQAAAYINQQTRMTPSKYLTEFDKNNAKKQLLDWDGGDIRRDLTASHSVVKIWQISFDHIRDSRSSAADLLSLMSFFNPQSIPESILRQYCKNSRAGVHNHDESIHRNEGQQDGSSSVFDSDLGTLQAYSLVKLDGADSCTMHALVQFCMQVWLSSSQGAGDAAHWKQEFVAIMAEEFPIGEFENWAMCRKLLPHIGQLFKDVISIEEGQLSKALAQIFTNAAWYLWMKGRYDLAQELATKAVMARERMSDTGNESTTESITIKALVLVSQGKYKEAKELSRRALKWYNDERGPLNTGTLTSVHNLAFSLGYQGKFEEAEKFNHQALVGREKELGSQHPYTLTSLNNLAFTLGGQGKFNDAELLYRRALDGRETKLDLQHPDTLTSVSNLALVLVNQGKYDEAEKLGRRALEGRIKELGSQHPDALRSAHDLMLVLGYQGKYEEAEKLGRQALQDREKELGKSHPDTLQSVSSLALILEHQGNYSEAATLNEQALVKMEETLGPLHPVTLIAMSRLTWVLGCQGKYDESERMCRTVLKRRETVLGSNHPDTLTSVSNLAQMLQHQGKYDEAETLNWRAMNGYQKELGPQHHYTLASESNLAMILGLQKKYDEAEKLYQRVIQYYDKELGPQHPDTLTSINNLASLKDRQENYVDAEMLYRRALDGREKQLGSQHPYTLMTVCNLASLLQKQRKYIESEKLSRWALEGREKALGLEHLDTLVSLNNLALVLGEQGKLEVAEELNQKAIEGREKILGETHVHTLTSVHCLACLFHLQKRYAEARKLYERACDGFESQLGPQNPTTVACKKHFSVMQEEEANMSQQGEEAKPSKESSVFARLKGKVRRKGA